jgi:hypothetical protein
VRLTGTQTTKYDAVLDRTTIESDGAAALAVIADPAHETSITLDAGQFRNTKASFRLTDDGRLTAASATVTGQGGTVISGLVGIATTALAVGARVAPFALLDFETASPEPTVPDVGNDQRRIEEQYQHDKNAESEARKTARQAVEILSMARRAAVSDVAAATTRRDRTSALRLADQLEAGLAQAEQVLDESEALFKAWRAGTITTSTVSYSQDITMDELRMSDVALDADGKLILPDPKGSKEHKKAVRSAQEKVRAGWRLLGCLVLIDGDPPDVEKRRSIPEEGSNMALWLAFPRPVTLKFYKTTEKGVAQLESVRPALIVDGESLVKRIEVSAGWFGENSGGLTFSDDGIPIGFDFGSTSAAAAAFSALGAAPATVASTLESVGKITDQLNAMTNKGLEHTLARTKMEVELKQQELSRAGLTATATDYAELERLKQQADLLEKRKALGLIATPADPVATQLADLRNQVALARLRGQLDRLTDSRQ